MSVEVGKKERHTVTFAFEKYLGNLSIKVDGRTFVRTVQVLSFKTVQTWELLVGVNEKHAVRIEKYRPRLFAGFRPQLVKAYVDDKLVAEGVA